MPNPTTQPRSERSLCGVVTKNLVRASIVTVLCSGGLPRPVATQDVVWRVADEPLLSIGGAVSDAGGGDLFGVRGVVRLSDGRIVVADQAPRVMVFAPDGSHLRTFGRRGEGPGEFGSIMWIQRLSNDTILVADLRNRRRLSYFTADGAFVRSISATSVPPPYFDGALADGTLVGTISRAPPRVPQSDGVWWGRGQIELVRFDAQGRVLNSLGVFPRTEQIGVPGFAVISADGWRSPGHRTLVVVGPARIYVATGDRFEVQVLAPDGGDPDILELDDYILDSLTREDVIRYFSDFRTIVNRIDLSTTQWNIPEGQTLPAITDLHLDEDGNLWAEEGGRATDDTGHWSVFTPSGRISATMSRRFRPFHIGSESVLGVWRDDLDVEYVQLRGIIKRGNP